MINVYEKYHLYSGETLIGVYSEIPIMEQDLSTMTPGTYIVKKIVETCSIFTIYGAGGNPMPSPPATPFPVLRTTVTRNHVDYNP